MTKIQDDRAAMIAAMLRDVGQGVTRAHDELAGGIPNTMEAPMGAILAALRGDSGKALWVCHCFALSWASVDIAPMGGIEWGPLWDTEEGDNYFVVPQFEDDDEAVEYASRNGIELPTRGSICDSINEAIYDDTSRFEPMMNVFWPISEFDESVAMELAVLLDRWTNLTLIRWNGVWGFGLTGGGMDMSECVILGYLLAGQFPPATLRIPGFAGTDYGKGRGLLLREAVVCSKVGLARRLLFNAEETLRGAF